ncbi:globin [Agrococcus sp. Ld7]|uniref:globin domain-containing protein n=1 Tax=Agrococcus sp. Ld7 TaxID=649148 RepID=UPI00386FB63F
MAPESGPQTLYDAVGGERFFRQLVHEFYDRVWADEVLHAMYPEHDRAGAEERFSLFLMQYWGGPGTYSERRGHPRLRMRHQPFPIDHAARNRWVACMIGALDALAPAPLHRAELEDYFERAATAMVNHNPLFR